MKIGGFVYTDDGWVIAPDGRRLRAIAGGGGGTKSKTTVNIPAKTPEETALLREQLEVTKTQNEFFRIQIEEVKKQNAIFAETIPAQKALFEAQTSALTNLARLQEEQFGFAKKLLEEQFKETPEQQKIRELSEERTLAFLEGRSPRLAPETTARLDTLFGTQREQGQQEIRRFAEELAGQRGLNLSDTPVAGEALRATERLETGLRGARAGAELDLTQSEAIASEQIRQFQEGLRQQAFMNRLSLVGAGSAAGSPLLGAAGALPRSSTGGLFGPADSTGLLNVMSNERIAGAKRTTVGQYNPGFFDYFSSIMGAVGGAAGAFAASSATLKRDILPLDVDEYEEARRTVKGLPIVRYRYKHEDDSRPAPHLGPLAETLPDEVREGPLHVNLLDLAGLTLAAVKGVDRRVDRLERRGLPVEVA